MRLALIGTGDIAYRFAGDMRYSAKARIVAVGGRNRTKASRLASAIGPSVAAGDIDETMALAGVDAVYIATSTDRHAEHALMALVAGKPVLVEKPLAASAAEAERVVEAARAAGLFAMEALWMRFTPGIRYLKAWADRGELGPLLRLQADVSFLRDSSHPDAGGAVADLGVYPISLALHLLGPASRVLATGRRDARGTVTQADLILTHGDASASLSCGWNGEGANRASLQGRHALAETVGSMLCPPALTLRRLHLPSIGSKGVRETSSIPYRRFRLSASLREALRPLRLHRRLTLFEGSGLHYQVDHMADCLGRQLTESLVMPLDESCAALRLIDQALQQIR